MKYSVKEIQEHIRESLPEGSVVAEHTPQGHFYRIMLPDEKGVKGNVYPSVTGKIQIIKDESLINYKKNQVIQYVFKNYGKFTDENIMEHLTMAERVPEDILADASDIGTEIHDTRERIFKEWIGTGIMPGDFLSFISPEKVDVRLKSATRALQKFCVERRYIPIATELFVFNHKLKVAGTLDDLGVMEREIEAGDPECEHDFFNKGKYRVCFACPRKVKDVFVLMDLKSSNQFKLHYWFQVSLYCKMISNLIGIKPEMSFILKLSKEDGTYKIEELKHVDKIFSYAKSMLRLNEGIQFIKEFRKDNQRKVSEPIEL